MQLCATHHFKKIATVKSSSDHLPIDTSYMYNPYEDFAGNTDVQSKSSNSFLFLCYKIMYLLGSISVK